MHLSWDNSQLDSLSATSIVILICYISRLNNTVLLGMKWVVKHQDLQMFDVTLNNTSNFHPLEVVDRGSETQLQVGDNLNTTTRVNNVLQSTQKC